MRCALRFAELAGQTMTMRGICDSNATGMKRGARDGRRFLSLRKPLTGRTTTGERAGGTHLPFSVLTAAQQGSPLPPSCAVSSLSLTLSPLIPHSPWPTVTASAVHQHRDSAARPWNARSRRRISPTSAHTSASRICVMRYATVAAAPRSRCRHRRISLALSLFLFSLLTLFCPPIPVGSVVGSGPVLIPGGQCSRQRYRDVRNACDNALSRRNASRGRV